MATSSSASESTPLMSNGEALTRSLPKPATPTRPTRSVTFSSQISSNSPPRRLPSFPPPSPFAYTSAHNPVAPQGPHDGRQPMLSALNSKLRRRNSQGAPLVPSSRNPASKIGPQRTTLKTSKLKLLPDPEHALDEESGRDVYSQFTRIKDPTARRDAARLGKDDRDKLPRVTAYCTAGSYRLDDLMRYLKGKAKSRGAVPKLIDECLYSPYRYSGRRGSGGGNRDDVAEVHSQPQRRHSDSAIEVDEQAERRREDLLDLQPDVRDDNVIVESEEPIHPTVSEELAPEPDFDTQVHTPEIFLFDYGVVVIWGMTLLQEQRFLKEIAKFEMEKLDTDDVQVENFNFYYTKEYQARIYNDFISLREKKNYMTKLAISHALAQSTKTSLYEDILDATIEKSKDVPSQIALTGKVNINRRQINMQIGELFILRINIHLQGSVLDAPELMWAEPQLEPVYKAVRSYLEMDVRTRLLNERLDVLSDLLQILKSQLSHTHGELLEWIVIILIGAEIMVALVNIFVDLYAGVD
ncbi:sporulation protein rmd1 [Elasticomyces elasticus]|nr:sporulation protein rmd1 [Elasticomyces elasticus]